MFVRFIQVHTLDFPSESITNKLNFIAVIVKWDRLGYSLDLSGSKFYNFCFQNIIIAGKNSKS